MSETMTLAHVSDVHLSPMPGVALRHLNVKRGLGYLNWQRQRRRTHTRPTLDLVIADLLAHKPDHIAVTGDLINLGLPAEYEAATAWLHEVGTPHARDCRAGEPRHLFSAAWRSGRRAVG